MQPDRHLPTIKRIAQKEITLFFASPVAWLFLATFAAVSLFVFFWGEAFFARNIADVRPLFEWMPILLIFLASALTMRLWSEEKRSGTIEHVLTQSVPLWHFVVGKFAGCLALLLIALLITLPLPFSVALMGDLDWGPVLGGYLATFLLGATYLSIGLFVSARSDNPIVSLISATALCAALYMLGNPALTDFAGQQLGEWLRRLGTGSRFDSITRGVIDFRDLYYYLSLIVVFLVLNTFVLEGQRWTNTGRSSHHRYWRNMTALIALNALAANFWIGQLPLRVDATEGNQYSLSQATENYLDRLEEPLLLRGYFSAKTHPLLAPLAPQLKDLLREYAVVGGDRLRVEFIDPARNPEQEEEANQRYGIQPTPFQVADRYEAAIVSSYFNVLVQYGDEHEVLGFQDLIEVRSGSETDLDVRLRNPEHDITRAIRKVQNSYQASGNLFDTVQDQLTFTAYISSNELLPDSLREFRKQVRSVVDSMANKANGRFSINIVDPTADDLENQLAEDFGFQPMTTSLFSDERFYFYMVLSDEDQHVQIPLGDLSENEFRRNLEAGIKRFARGFTKTVAFVAPEAAPQYSRYGSRFSQLEQFLSQEMKVKREDLSDGAVAGDADLLFLAAPENLDAKALFAVDQFLMQGGTVVLASSPFRSDLSGRQLSVRRVNSGLDDWLKHHGVHIDNALVLDKQNAALPVPVTRTVGGFQLQELRMLDYPYFIDLRGSGLNQEHPVTADLLQLTVPWASPIKVSLDETSGLAATNLLQSSPGSWLSDSTDVMPNVDSSGTSTFTPTDETGSEVLGISLTGRFTSYFADKDSPVLTPETADDEASNEATTQNPDDAITASAAIKHSPESARLIIFSSNDFLSDQAIGLASSAARSEYLNSLQLAANTVEWALDDSGLLSIRGRGHFNRTLPPMGTTTQMLWEYLNYAFAGFALITIALVQRHRRRNREHRYRQLIINV
ncbi:Gldg family protein [Litorivivens sp.]|uniref:Gldg family protein n=1 Tax=Litorivivens sp. TaxID=2020868 RepID=UPI00356216F3